MRRIIASEFVSADGYMVGKNEDMSWVFKTFNDEMGKYAGDLMASMDTLLLGRVTYQIMRNAWPNMTEEQSPGANTMNSVRKIVVSTTLDSAPWGKYVQAQIIKNNIEQQIKELKQEQGRRKNIVIYGSGSLVHSLTKFGLIDEYQLLVHPILLGGGKQLFKPMEGSIDLKLLQTHTFSNGVNVLYYEPK
ncbi:MAG: dihydrofolate reductase family protein [Thaumarchaeota archaeon]|nr:dihydrofolate reductase family protein [Nitrososphaerota archaeon]